jgi:hypothetical protein
MREMQKSAEHRHTVPFRNFGGLPSGSTLNVEYSVHERNVVCRTSPHRSQRKVGRGSIIMGLVGICGGRILGIRIGSWF